MKESDLRKLHRTLGIVLAVFIVLQAGSGFLISVSQMSVSHIHAHEKSHPPGHGHEEGESLWHESMEFIHHGGGTIGTIYRLVVGIGMLVMAVTGSMIYFEIRARFRKS